MTDSDIKQQVIVPYDFSKAAEHALLYAIQIAALFKSEISLIFSYRKNLNDSESLDIIKGKLAMISNDITETNQIPTHVYVFHEKISEVINKVYQKLNGLVVVCGLNSNKNKSQFFTTTSFVTDYRNLRIPLLAVWDELNIKSFFQHIILPLDFNRESKEKSAWAGYIAKLKQSRVSVLTRNYKDAYFSASLRNNMATVIKLFNEFEIDYQFKNEPDIRCPIEKYAVEYAWLNKGDLLVLTATKDLAVDDLLFGLKEKKIIENKYRLPVLLVNPRDDIYLPCGC